MSNPPKQYARMVSSYTVVIPQIPYSPVFSSLNSSAKLIENKAAETRFGPGTGWENIHGEGSRTRRVSNIRMANAIIDWTWLSSADRLEFADADSISMCVADVAWPVHRLSLDMSIVDKSVLFQGQLQFNMINQTGVSAGR